MIILKPETKKIKIKRKTTKFRCQIESLKHLTISFLFLKFFLLKFILLFHSVLLFCSLKKTLFFIFIQFFRIVFLKFSNTFRFFAITVQLNLKIMRLWTLMIWKTKTKKTHFTRQIFFH